MTDIKEHQLRQKETMTYKIRKISKTFAHNDL